MSASYAASADILKNIEGGYCMGAKCGTAASGETYRGIDRNQAGKTWPGWQYIDAWKRQYGQPKHNHFFTGTAGALINAAADQFWASWWNKYGIGRLTNQHLAAMFYAWLAQGQTRAMADINALAKKYGATQTSSTTITANAAAAINRNQAAVYSSLRKRIRDFYTSKGLTTLIKNRVDIFPVSISNTQAAAAGAAKAGGVFGWLAAMLGLSQI